MIKSSEKFFKVYILNATRDFDAAYTYAGAELSSELRSGQIVELPFGRANSLRRAVVYEEVSNKPEFKLKAIKRILTPEPLLVPEHFLLAEEIRRRYFVSRGQALMTMMPQTVWQVGKKTAWHARLKDPEEAIFLLEEDSLASVGRVRVVEFLLYEEEATLEEIRINCNVSQAVLKGLEKKSILEFFKKAVPRDFSQEKGLEVTEVDKLNLGQAEVLKSLIEAAKLEQFETQDFSPKISETKSDSAPELKEYLLHGITGSGKTEVFLRAAEAVLAAGRSVIILVPEIALTPLMEARVKARFGEAAVILHSRLTATQRFENWRALANGSKRLVIGARSAIFAPVQNLGLIVVDEEQESSYKSDLSPRYDAREIARIRALINSSVLLLASATPAVETFYRTESGKSKLLELTERAGAATLPEIELVDLRRELGTSQGKLLSDPLTEALNEAFARGEQAMLFLNRRGHSNAVLCKTCGEVINCPDCDVALTEHLNFYQKDRSQDGERTLPQRLICHYCGKVYPAPQCCPLCGADSLICRGYGTQRLEAYFEENFAPYKALRMDVDTTYTRRAYHDILQSFAAGEAQCLIGTQMIAKGHDFPKVTVVGIISADQLLTDFDYRAAERCFQLITQAAGRAGRERKAGSVFVQAYNCEHYALLAGLKQDYASFYQQELALRKKFSYPPFGQIATIVYTGSREAAVRAEARKGQLRLEAAVKASAWQSEVQLFPAQKAPLAKLKSRYRYRIILKAKDRLKLTQLLNWEQERQCQKEISRAFDINPNSML
ncbi:MAG: primosomal protein N' [Eubacteriales bacterium]|nr:primosomal protein N' [Eubacteriales bacterium]